MNSAGLKRRLIFVPLPEPEPLHTEYRAILPSSGGPVGPLLHPEAPVGAGASVLSGVLHPLYHKLISYQDPFFDKYQQNIDFKCCMSQNNASSKQFKANIPL